MNSEILFLFDVNYPLVEIPSLEHKEDNKDKEKYENCRNLSHSHNLFQYCKILPSKNYINIDKKWLILKF